MAETTMPDWVLIEAAKRSGWYDCTPTFLREDYSERDNGAFRALCDMILKHEQPPRDRKVLCAREAAKHWWEHGGTFHSIGIRAIELWEQGFGQ